MKNTIFIFLISSLSQYPQVSAVPCSCDNGIGKDDGTCLFETETGCESCNAFYHLENDACLPNVCTCPLGTPMATRRCDQHLKEKCQDCMGNNALDFNTFLCVPYTCTCDNGTVATANDSCVEDNAEICSSCNPGFSPEFYDQFDASRFRCKENTCTCALGTPKTGAECTTDNAEICDSCQPFHHVNDQGICVPNSCQCDNGVAVVDQFCAVHNDTECATCNSGFHKIGKECAANQCVCPHGEVVTDCSVNGAEECSSCYGGFTPIPHSNGGFVTCQINICTCSNGIAKVSNGSNPDEFCSQNGAEECSSCLGETVLSPISRNANATCDDQACDCQNCPAFSHKENNVCAPNICTCDNGLAVDNSACVSHDVVQCQSCEFGFRLENDECLENICTCGNGVAAEACSQNGAEECDSCDDEYELNGLICEVRECVCSNGVAVNNADCLVRRF